MILQDFTKNVLSIEAIDEPKKDAKANGAGKYELQINPENYSRTVKIISTCSGTRGDDGGTQSVQGIAPEVIQLTFTLDDTGVTGKSPYTGDSALGGLLSSLPINPFAGLGPPTVTESVEQFIKVCGAHNGEIHQPNYLRMVWGDLFFICVLSKASVDYSYFNTEGKPLRAKISATFKEAKAKDEEEEEKGNTSPDLTHVHVVKRGDRLPQLAFEVYGDSKYFIEVARANELENYRRLSPGQEIVFPPLSDIGK